MKNNKLIAEFNGWKLSSDGVTYINPQDQDDCWLLQDMLFHDSWDWLMPVVEKCMQTGDNTDEWDDLYNALSTVNKTNLHQAVVEFIKQYNK